MGLPLAPSPETGIGSFNPGVSLTGKKKKVFRYQFSQKSPQALHVLNHGWWQLAVGGWQRLAWQLATGGWWRLVVVGGGWWLAVGGWRRLAVVGSWRLVAAGGWRRLVAGGWWWLVVGGWWRLAVDGSWRLAVGGPLGRSLRAVLSKKKKISSLKEPLFQPKVFVVNTNKRQGIMAIAEDYGTSSRPFKHVRMAMAWGRILWHWNKERKVCSTMHTTKMCDLKACHSHYVHGMLHKSLVIMLARNRFCSRFCFWSN